MKIYSNGFESYHTQWPALKEKSKRERAERRENLLDAGIRTTDHFLFFKKKTYRQLQIESDMEDRQSRASQERNRHIPARISDYAPVHGLGDEREQDVARTKMPLPPAEKVIETPSQALAAATKRSWLEGSSKKPASSKSVTASFHEENERTTESGHSKRTTEHFLYWAPENLKSAWQRWVGAGHKNGPNKTRTEDELETIGLELNRYLGADPKAQVDLIKPFLNSLNPSELRTVQTVRHTYQLRSIHAMLDWVDQELSDPARADTGLSTAWRNWISASSSKTQGATLSNDALYRIGSELNKFLHGDARASFDIMRPFLGTLNDDQVGEIDRISDKYYAQRRFIQATNLLPANTRLAEEVTAIFDSIRDGSSALSLSERNELQLTLGAKFSPSTALETALNAQGIRVVGSALEERGGQVPSPSLAVQRHKSAMAEPGPGPSSAAFAGNSNTGGSKRLQGRAYGRQVRDWARECSDDIEEFNTRLVVIKKINGKLNSNEEFTLDIGEFSDLSSPPPMPLLGTKIKVKENQFSTEALDQLRLTGVDVIIVSSADVKPDLIPDPRPAIAGSDEPSKPIAPFAPPERHHVKAKDYAVAPQPSLSKSPINTAPVRTSRKLPLPPLQKQLKAWVSLNADETDARERAANEILTWLGRYNSDIWDQESGRRTKGVRPLDLSSKDDLKFSTIPPLPSDVETLRINDQNISKVDIKKLPENLKNLDLSGNPLTSIDDENLSNTLSKLHVILGVTTTLAPRLVRKLNTEGRKPSYTVNLPSSNTLYAKRDTYDPEWSERMPEYQAYIDKGSVDREARMNAVSRLEEWVHGDNNETSSTPLNFKNLGLMELPPVWPHTAKIKSIDAKGNRLQKIPLSSLPPTLKFLDLRNNNISKMPAELTAEQMAARDAGKGKGKAEVTSPKALIQQMQELGFTLADPDTVDPREGADLVIIMAGNPLDGTMAEAYEAREYGPSYIYSPHAVQEIEKDVPELSEESSSRRG